jgi:hypothetical protein
MEKKSRGRPKGPSKLYFRAYVTGDEADWLDRELSMKRHGHEGLGALGVGTRMEVPEPSTGLEGKFGTLVSKEDWKAGKVPFHAYDGPPVFRSDGKILDGSIAENEAKGQIKALLDDVERLTEQVSYLEGKVQEALGMDLDEKGRLGWKLYYQLKDEKEVNEHDQER